jgi:hypothetical protein
VLGDANLVSWDLQQMLGSVAFVGRLGFADDSGYETYVEKVLRSEADVPASGASALFYAVRDGTLATVQGYRHLVSPLLHVAREDAQSGTFPAQEIREIGRAKSSSSRGSTSCTSSRRAACRRSGSKLWRIASAFFSRAPPTPPSALY